MSERTIRLKGAATIVLPSGQHFMIQPAANGGLTVTAIAAVGPGPVGIAATTGRGRGRPLSPAVVAVRRAMSADAAGSGARPRAYYADILWKSGHKSEGSANLILAREARRAFGRTLGRGGGGSGSSSSAGGDGSGKRGRKPTRETELVRAKLGDDAKAGNLRDASFYTKWLVNQPGVRAGLKQVRPIVYRELRAAKGGADA